jgi:hypothetical protein
LRRKILEEIASTEKAACFTTLARELLPRVAKQGSMKTL